MRGMRVSGIGIAVVSAGFVVGLAGCGPLTSTGMPRGAGTPTNSGSMPASPTLARPSGSASASASTTAAPAANNAYAFTTIDNPADLTFNQLLGMNNRGVIASYFGSGAANHPNKGYELTRHAAGFTIASENFPGSVQTQVTGLNDIGVTVGFWSNANNADGANANFGFYRLGGQFHTVNFPATSMSNPPVNQLLGVNDHNLAVGFYNDAKGNSHGYTYSIIGGRFHTVSIRGAVSVTATAINNNGDVAGFSANAAGTTNGFLRTARGRVFTLAVPGASMTQPLGVNDFREVVGVYTVGTGDNAVSHGFTWTPLKGFKTVDDPQGAGTTTINGVNDFGFIVGFYVDGAGNTDGFVAVPGNRKPLPGLITATPMPTPTTTSPMPTPTTTSPMPTPTPTTTSPTPTPTSGSPTPTRSPNPSLSPTHF